MGELPPKIESPNELRRYYEKQSVVREYLKERFSDPIGIVQNLAQLNFANEVMGANHINNVLEIAPGPARIGAEVQPKVLGCALDFSEAMLLQARKRFKSSKSNWIPVRGDAFQLPFKSGSFDLVMSFRLLRHFHDSDRARLYLEVRRVLREPSLFVFDAPNFKVEFPYRTKLGLDKFPIFDKLWKREELTQELEYNKFEIIHFRGIVNRFSLFRKISLLARFFGSGPVASIMSLIERVPSGDPMEWCVLCRAV